MFWYSVFLPLFVLLICWFYVILTEFSNLLKHIKFNFKINGNKTALLLIQRLCLIWCFFQQKLFCCTRSGVNFYGKKVWVRQRISLPSSILNYGNRRYSHLKHLMLSSGNSPKMLLAVTMWVVPIVMNPESLCFTLLLLFYVIRVTCAHQLGSILKGSVHCLIQKSLNWNLQLMTDHHQY